MSEKGSKETNAIWNGAYGESEFREKVDKLLFLGESRKSLKLLESNNNVERIKRVWGLEPVSNFVEKC
jgi:hypothetical protein